MISRWRGDQDVGQRDHFLVGEFRLLRIRLQLVDENFTSLKNCQTLQRFRGEMYMGKAPFVESILRTSLEDARIRQDAEQIDREQWKGSRERALQGLDLGANE